MHRTVITHRTEDGKSATEAVVMAIAAVSNTDPLELPPLYNTIDTEALDTIIECGSDVEIEFEYNGYIVEIAPSEVRIKQVRHAF